MFKFCIFVAIALLSSQARANEDEIDKRSAIPDYYSDNAAAAAYPNYPAQPAAAAAPAPAVATAPSAAPYAQARSDVASPADSPSAAPAQPSAPATPAAAPAAASSAPAAPASAPAAESSSYASPTSYPYTASKPREDSAYARSSYPSYPYPAPAPAPAPAPYYSAGYQASYAAQRQAAAAPVAAVHEKADARYTLPSSEPLTPPDKHSITKCFDDRRAENFCMQSNNPCFCEENRHFMFNYCKRSCGFCSDAGIGHRFWRLSNGEPMQRTWIVKEVKFFTDKFSAAPLNNVPAHAFASSQYLGYPAALAMDSNERTGWQPDGWWERPAQSEFVGYEFDAPVIVNSILVEGEDNPNNRLNTEPRTMFVEAADYKEGPWSKLWMIENFQNQKTIRFNNPKCPLFWKRFASNEGTFCYKMYPEHLNFQMARDKCARDGGDLVSINSIEEGRWILSDVKLCGFTWLGLNDIQSEGNFEWSDGSNKTFAFWAADEIKDDRQNAAEDCAAMSKNGEWRQFHCDDKFYFICKKPLIDRSEEDAKAEIQAQESNKTALPVLPNGMQFPFPLPFPFPMPGQTPEQQPHHDTAAKPAPEEEHKDSGSAASEEDEDEEDEEDDEDDEEDEEEASGSKKSEAVEAPEKEEPKKEEKETKTEEKETKTETEEKETKKEAEKEPEEKTEKSTNEDSDHKSKRDYIFYSD